MLVVLPRRTASSFRSALGLLSACSRLALGLLSASEEIPFERGLSSSPGFPLRYRALKPAATPCLWKNGWSVAKRKGFGVKKGYPQMARPLLCESNVVKERVNSGFSYMCKYFCAHRFSFLTLSIVCHTHTKQALMC
jgi:hypothetical protein